MVCVSDSYAGSDVGPVDFINSVIDGAGAGAFACVAGASVFSRELSFCAVEDVLLELLAGVNGFNPWFRAARVCADIGTLVPEAIDCWIA